MAIKKTAPSTKKPVKKAVKKAVATRKWSKPSPTTEHPGNDIGTQGDTGTSGGAMGPGKRKRPTTLS